MAMMPQRYAAAEGPEASVSDASAGPGLACPPRGPVDTQTLPKNGHNRRFGLKELRRRHHPRCLGDPCPGNSEEDGGRDDRDRPVLGVSGYQ